MALSSGEDWFLHAFERLFEEWHHVAPVLDVPCFSHLLVSRMRSISEPHTDDMRQMLDDLGGPERPVVVDQVPWSTVYQTAGGNDD